ncbi:MAG: PilZ domain-containing protein [Pseudomonadota bacterium]
MFQSSSRRGALSSRRSSAGPGGQRREPRESITKSASILVEETGQVISCTLRDINTRGARMSVASHAGIPDTFILKCRQAELNTRARVAWRRGYELGVSFMG